MTEEKYLCYPVEVRRELYKDIVSHYGTWFQMVKCMEECGELIQAISKYIGSDASPEAEEHIIEEIADVQILLEQVMTMFKNGEDRVQLIMAEKIDRTLVRIGEGGRHSK